MTRSTAEETPVPPIPSLRRRAATVVLIAALLGVAVLSTSPAAALPTQDEPALDQTIDAGEPVADGAAILHDGHVDLGPRFVDDEWSLLVRDDGAEASQWRRPDDTVFVVGDVALLPVPDDERYRFVGAAPGAMVHVIPQTQAPDVVWMGWNTQDPEVMTRIDRGVTLSLLEVDGPGTVTTYLQGGNLEAPQLLWDSRTADAQPIYVDVNTHTHANWVFTEPGTYRLRMEVSAELVTGERVTDQQTIRFAVGDATDPQDALDAAPLAETSTAEASVAEGEDPTSPVAEGDATPGVTEAPDGDGDGSFDVPPVALGPVVGALLLAAAVGTRTVRGSRTKARADAQRRPGGGS